MLVSRSREKKRVNSEFNSHASEGSVASSLRVSGRTLEAVKIEKLSFGETRAFQVAVARCVTFDRAELSTLA